MVYTFQLRYPFLNSGLPVCNLKRDTVESTFTFNQRPKKSGFKGDEKKWVLVQKIVKLNFTRLRLQKCSAFFVSISFFRTNENFLLLLSFFSARNKLQGRLSSFVFYAMELSVNEIPTLLTKEQKIARNVDGHFDVYCLCRCCNNALMAVTSSTKIVQFD